MTEEAKVVTLGEKDSGDIKQVISCQVKIERFHFLNEKV